MKKIAKSFTWTKEECARLTEGQNCRDLARMAADRGVIQRASAGLAKIYLKVDLDKRATQRFSNWNASALTDAQIKYAALDADVSLRG